MKKNIEKTGSFLPIPGWIVFRWHGEPTYARHLVRDTPENRKLIAKARFSWVWNLVGLVALYVGSLGIVVSVTVVSVTLGHGISNPAAIACIAVTTIGLLVAIMSYLTRERSRSAVMSSEGTQPLGSIAQWALSDLEGTIQADDGPLIAEGAEKGVAEEVILRIHRDRSVEEGSRRRAMADSIVNTRNETR